MSLYNAPSRASQRTNTPVPSYLYLIAAYLAAVALSEVARTIYLHSQTNFESFDASSGTRIAIRIALCALLVVRPLLRLAYSLIPHLLLGVVVVALLMSATFKEGTPDTVLAAGYYVYPDALRYIESPSLVPSLLYPERKSITPHQLHYIVVANKTAGTFVLAVLCALLFRARLNDAHAAGIPSPN